MKIKLLIIITILCSIANAEYLGSWNIGDYITFTVNTHTTGGEASDANSVPSYRIYEDETVSSVADGNMAKLDDPNTLGFYSEREELTPTNYNEGKHYSIYITATVDGNTGTTSHNFQVEPNTVNLSSATETQIDEIETDTNEIQTDWTDAGRLDTILDSIEADTSELQTDWTNGGRLDLILDDVFADTNDLQTNQGNWTTAGAGDIKGAEVDVTKIGGVAQSATDLKDFADAGYDPSVDKVTGVVLVDTTTTNTDMVGTDGAITSLTAITNDKDSYKATGFATPSDVNTSIDSKFNLTNGVVDSNVQTMTANSITATVIDANAIGDSEFDATVSASVDFNDLATMDWTTNWSDDTFGDYIQDINDISTKPSAPGF